MTGSGPDISAIAIRLLRESKYGISASDAAKEISAGVRDAKRALDREVVGKRAFVSLKGVYFPL